MTQARPGVPLSMVRDRRAGWRAVWALILLELALAVFDIGFGGPVGVERGTASVPQAAPLRVLVVGDSVAETFGLSLGIDAARFGATLQVDAMLGCGVAVQQANRSHGQADDTIPPCNSSTPASQQWPAQWTNWINEYRPQVVLVLAGKWETQDVELNGRWTSILQPDYAAEVRSRLDQAVQVGSAAGAHVDLLTSPCFDPGRQPNGKPSPENSPARVAAYNRAVRAAAEAQPSRASVLDLNRLVCPAGKFHLFANGVQIRAVDGVHFPDSFSKILSSGMWLGPRIWPEILGPDR